MKYVIGGFLFMWGWQLLRAAVEMHRANAGSAEILAGRNAPPRRSPTGFTCEIRATDPTPAAGWFGRASNPSPSRNLSGWLLLGGAMRRMR